jgi:hypothetical protein
MLAANRRCPFKRISHRYPKPFRDPNQLALHRFQLPTLAAQDRRPQISDKSMAHVGFLVRLAGSIPAT